MADKMLTHEETIQKLSEIAKAKGDDFYVKVSRRVHIGSIPQQIASFSGAQVIHVVNPETWLPRIAGGGPTFILQVFHASDPAVQVGSPVVFSVAVDNCPPKNVDPAAVRHSGWTGPVKLEWPKEDDMKAAAGTPAYSIAPPLSPNGNSATSHNVPGGAGAAQPPYYRDPEREALVQERARLQRDRTEWEERKRRDELDEIRHENERRMKDLETRLVSAQPKENMAQTIAVVLTAAAPIVQAMIQSNNETRIAVMKSQEEAARQTQELLRSLLTRPAVDPTIEKAFDKLQVALEKKSNESVPQTQMLHSMAEAMGTMTDMTMNLVQTAAELNLGGQREDHPALKAIKEGVKAMNALFSGYQTASQMPRKALPQQPTQRLPAAVLPPPPQQQQQQQQQQQPAPAAHSGFAGHQGGQQTIVDKLHDMIMAKADPTLVVKLFIDSLDDPDMQKALDEVGGDITELVARRVGPWVMSDQSNAEYLKHVLDEFSRQGQEAGIFDDEETEGDEGGDVEDESNEEVE